MFSRTSIEMDVEFLDRMSQISRRVRSILDESEKMKGLLAERIARRAEKAIEAAEVAEEIQNDLEVSDDEKQEDVDDEDEADEDEDEADEDEDEAEKPLEPVKQEEEEEDNDFSDCWTCLCGRRR